jgi:hypothetical protein
MDGTSEGKRQTAEQAAALAKKTVEQNEFQHGRRDPYRRMMSWLLPRISRSWLISIGTNSGMNAATVPVQKFCDHTSEPRAILNLEFARRSVRSAFLITITAIPVFKEVLLP